MRCVRHVSEESKKSKVEVKTSALSPQSPEQQVANTKGPERRALGGVSYC